MKKILLRFVEFIWFKDQFIAILLVPFSLIFIDFVRFRRFLYHRGILKKHSLPVPVIVIGNITVGGTGKTPLLISIAKTLTDAGYKPGIISRGYGGHSEQWPVWVNTESDSLSVGDEAVLIAHNTDCPIAVGPERVKAAQLLLQKTECDIILSDDGLQHYTLARDIEIAVIDGTRRFGNGYSLPAGPLREPISRLLEVDLVICNGPISEENEFTMDIDADYAVNLHTGAEQPLSMFSQQPCHAIAGIGNPNRFFKLLQDSDIHCKTHIFPDHHEFQAEEIYFNDDKTVLMTEKDAVKCTAFAKPCHWYVPITARPEQAFTEQLLKLLGK